MIAVTMIPQEIQVKETFAVEGTASSDFKGKTIALTVDNQFKTLGNVVNDDGSWQVEFQFLQPGDRSLKISIGDESETRMIKVIIAPPRLRFTSIPPNIKTEEKFTLAGEADGFDGDYTTRTITNEQFESAVALCTKLCQRMGIKDPTELVSTQTASFGTKKLPRIIGHRDRFNTDCPGVKEGKTVRLEDIRQAVKQAL